MPQCCRQNKQQPKTRRLMAFLGFDVVGAEYENVWGSVSQRPTLYTAVPLGPLRRSVLAHMFLLAHANDAFLMFFMQNKDLMREVASEMDACLASKKHSSQRAARKYANFLKLRGLLLLQHEATRSIKLPPSKSQMLSAKESKRAAHLLQILIHYCQFVVDCCDEKKEAFVVKKVGRCQQSFYDLEVAPQVPARPQNAFELEIKKLFKKAATPRSGRPREAAAFGRAGTAKATKIKAAGLLCPSVADIDQMLAKFCGQ